MFVVRVPANWNEGQEQEKTRIMRVYENVFHQRSDQAHSVAVMARQSAGIPLKKSMKPMLMAVQEALAGSAGSQASERAPARCTRVVIYTDCAQDFTEVCDIASEGVPRDWTSRPQRGRSSLCQPFACMENCCISFAIIQCFNVYWQHDFKEVCLFRS